MINLMLFRFADKKLKTNKIDSQAADQMLQNIFEVCDVEPNTVPLEQLASYTGYRRDRFLLQKVILILVMVLFIAIPVMFFPPSPKISDYTTTNSKPSFTMSVDSLLPITSVTATVDGQNVPVYENDSQVYSIEPNASGMMTVTVTALNKQYETLQVPVTIDRQVPDVVRNISRGDYIYLYPEDPDSGINWSQIYAKETDGTTIYPVNYNEIQGWVSFKKPEEFLNIFIPDNSKNTLQVVLTMK